jgi:hypothetical protein
MVTQRARIVPAFGVALRPTGARVGRAGTHARWGEPQHFMGFGCAGISPAGQKAEIEL